MWVWKEFQLLEGTGEARRGAGFLCDLAGAVKHRPMGMLANFSSIPDELHWGWPLVPMGKSSTLRRTASSSLFMCRYCETNAVVLVSQQIPSLQLGALGTRFWSCCTPGPAPFASQLSSSSSLTTALGSWAWFFSFVEGTAAFTSVIEQSSRHEAERGFPLFTSALCLFVRPGPPRQ